MFSLLTQEPRDTNATDSNHETLWIETHASTISFSFSVTLPI